MRYKRGMSFLPTRPVPLLAALATAALMAAGCSKPPPPPAPAPPPSGVSANSGGDTRGTVLYHPPPPPKKPPNPYAAVSDKIVIGQRQRLAWALAEIDLHAHAQALQTYPVPDPSWRGYTYTKQKAVDQALRQAKFNAYLLEKHHARFCNQFHISYDQLVLIIKEGREKNWPMPPAPKE